MVVTPDGLILIAGGDGILVQVRLEVFRHLTQCSSDLLFGQQLSPDGSMLLVQAPYGAVHVVDTAQTITFEANDTELSLFHFADDGRSLVGFEVARTDEGWTGTVSTTRLPDRD